MDSIDDLLAELLARPDTDWRAGLEELCRRHPGAAEQLRRRFRHLERCGVATPVAQSNSADGLPERFGPYRLLRRLGTGGMGTVWLANHEAMDREVAVKMIRPERLWIDRARERFRREIAAVARLRHPGCVQIHQVGEADGVPYFAMEFVAGASCERIVAALRERLAGRPVTELRGSDLHAVLTSGAEQAVGNDEFFAGSWVHVAVRIVMAAAEALAHAHARGVIHRDLKPGNLMVTPDGRVVVIDFGLAAADGSSALTREGSQLGSLPYMAPEQLRADGAPIDARTDVYALGVCLWELLASAPAFEARDELALRANILTGNVPSLRGANPAVGPDLATVIAQAMHVDPNARYPSALAFAADLVAVLEDRPIAAARESTISRLRRQARRHPALATAIALLLLGLLLIPTAISFGVAAERDRALAAERHAEQRAYMANVAAAGAALFAGNGKAARVYLDACPEAARDFEWNHLHLATDSSQWRVKFGGGVTALATAPDGGIAVASGPGALALLSPAAGRHERDFELPAPAVVQRAAFDAAGGELFSVDEQQTLRVHDVATGRLLRQRSRAHASEHVYLPQVADPIVAVGDDARLLLLDPLSLAPRRQLDLELRGWSGAAGVRISRQFVTAVLQDSLTTWNLTDGRVHAEHRGESLSELLLSDEGGSAVVANDNGVGVWSVDEPAIRWRPLSGRRPKVVMSLGSQRVLLVGCNNGELLVDQRERMEWRRLLGHVSAVTALAAMPRPGVFVSGDADGWVRLWCSRATAHSVELQGNGWGAGLAVSRDGTLFSGGLAAIVWACDPATGAVHWRHLHEHWVNGLAVLDAAQLLAVSVGQRIHLHNMGTGAIVGEIELPFGLSRHLAVAPDGRHLVAAAPDGRLAWIDVERRRAVVQPSGCDSPTGAWFRRDGRLLIGGRDGLFEVAAGDGAAASVVRHAAAECRALAGTGGLIYTCERDLPRGGWLLVERDAGSGSVLRSQHSGDELTALCVLNDRRIVAGTKGGNLVVFDRGTLSPVLNQPDFPDMVLTLVADPAGQWVAAVARNSDPRVHWQRALPPESVGERQLVADLRHRLQVAVATQPWAPLARENLLSDAGLDDEARATLEMLVPPTSRWSIGRRALYTAVAPALTEAATTALRAQLQLLQHAVAEDVDPHGPLVRTALAMTAARLGESRLALETVADVLDGMNAQSRSMLGPCVHFARALAHRQLGDAASARQERDLLANLLVRDAAVEPFAFVLLRELDEAPR